MKKYIVPNINCRHCVMKVDNALKQAGISAKIDLSDKSVTTDADENAVRGALKKIGYPAE